MLKFIRSLKTVFHRPQAITRWVRDDRVEQRKKEGWKVVKGNFVRDGLVLMRKG